MPKRWQVFPYIEFTREHPCQGSAMLSVELACSSTVADRIQPFT